MKFMKRLALFLMALIVPMQFAWANIACYSHTQVKNTHFEHVDSHDKDCVSHSHSHNFIEHEVGNANAMNILRLVMHATPTYQP